MSCYSSTFASYGTIRISWRERRSRPRFPTRPQLDWVNRAYKGAGLFTRKQTRAGRFNGARAAELRRVSEAEICRAGHWNTDAMTNCYLTNVPCEFSKAMAGVDLRTPGNYYIPHARVPVPEFPETIYVALGRRLAPMVYDNLSPTLFCAQLPEVVKGVQLERRQHQRFDRDDLASGFFLICSGSCESSSCKTCPSCSWSNRTSPLRSSPVFSREDDWEFVDWVPRACAAEQPYQVRLQQTIPMVADHLRTHQQEQAAMRDSLAAGGSRELRGRLTRVEGELATRGAKLWSLDRPSRRRARGGLPLPDPDTTCWWSRRDPGSGRDTGELEPRGGESQRGCSRNPVTVFPFVVLLFWTSNQVLQ